MPQEEQDKYAYLFSEAKDSDVYSWFEELGAYSPLVHLQQTDGTYSKHRPFTNEYNRTGIIKPKEVFKSIAKSYEKPQMQGMPPRAENIYLAFEIFMGVTDSNENILHDLKESVSYWREYLPEDGMTLNELI